MEFNTWDEGIHTSVNIPVSEMRKRKSGVQEDISTATLALPLSPLHFGCLSGGSWGRFLKHWSQSHP